MKLANEITLDLKRRGSSSGKPALITLPIDELVLESIITAKLEPVREALNGMVEVVSRLDKVGGKAFADGAQGTILYETVCALRAGVSDYGKVKVALAMLSEKETDERGDNSV